MSGKYTLQTPIAGCHISNDSGIVIFDLNDEFVVAGLSLGNKPYSKVRKHQIHFDNDGNPYFNKLGMKVFLSDCIRFNM